MGALPDLLFETSRKYPQKAAFEFKENGRYTAISWQEAAGLTRALSSKLASLGVGPGERVAILSENRYEWALTDMAALSLGAASVPIYTSLTSEEIEYLLFDSGSCVLAVSNKNLIEKILPICQKLPKLKTILAFDSTLALYAEQFKIPLLLFKDCVAGNPAAGEAARFSEDTLASIIYTSGTTGPPKGVELTHGNFLSNMQYIREALQMSGQDKHLSFLPLSHVFERTAGYYLMVSIGATIAYAESMDTISQNILETRPTFLLGVPRFYEKIREKIFQKLESSSSLKKALFTWAVDVGRKKRSGFKYAIAEKLVFNKFKKSFGGRLRFGVSGGAPLSKEVALFFYDLGMTILEGYGLTETSPVISVNREGRFKFGSVGVPLKGVMVQITEEGEVITKSSCVMRGYWKKPLETSEVLKDGWFYTGDLGEIDPQGFLHITGRKKELIITSGGKKVAPRLIEEQLEKDPAILRAVLYGDGRKCITAFIVPRKDLLLNYAEAQKIAFKDYASLLQNKNVYQFFENKIEELTKNLASYEKIKFFILLENDFTQAAGELTPTLKIKRSVIARHYGDFLEPFYRQ